MKNPDRSKEQLAAELAEAHRRIAELEVLETEWVRMEEELRQSEERYRVIFETTGTAMTIVEEDTTMSLVNTKLEKLSGYSREELEGKKSWAELIVPDDLERMKEQHRLRRVDPDSASKSYETRLVDRRGGIKDVLLFIDMIPGTKKSVASLLDITERKKAEEALKRRMEQLTALSQASQAVTASLELDQVLTQIVSLTNEVMDSDYTSVALVDERGQMNRSTENLPGVPGVEYRIRKKGLAAWITASGQPVIVDQIDTEGVISPPLGKGAPRLANPHIVKAGVRSVAGLPLIAKDKLLGVMFLHSLRPATFHGQLPVLVAFANQAAIAIENARLYEQAQQEIAERKRAELELGRLKDFNEGIIQNMTEGIVVQDLEGYFIFANPAAASLLGYPLEELVGLHWTDVIPPDQQSIVRAADERRVRGESDRYEVDPVRSDGTRFSVLISAAPRFAADTGRFIGSLAVFTDITERKRAEKERARLLAQMQQVMNSVPEGVLLLDSDGRVILINPIGRDYLDFLCGESKDIPTGKAPLTHLGHRPLAKVLAPPPKDMWHEIEFKDLVFQAVARPIKAGPTPEAWVLVIRDVTRQREIQQRIQQQERLASVGQLAAGIAHDFNNIMSSIVLYTGMALRLPDIEPKLRKRLDVVSQQSRRAIDLVNQILDFSRRAVLERRPMNLEPFMKEQVKLLKRTLPENIKIKLNYGLGDHMVNADPTRMQQVIMNLALNARDAMPKGGELRIDLERTRTLPPGLEAEEEGEWVVVTVADTGVGIPPDALPHIFEPFFTTRAPLGTGLGLAQVHGIIKQHGGEISVSTRVGQGTTFSYCLPALLVPEPEVVEDKARSLIKGEGETILVVEDNPDVRKALLEALEMLNYCVLEAENGREALELLESKDKSSGVAMVLSDLVMPEMSGAELAQALKQRGHSVPLVVLTGYPLEDEVQDLWDKGIANWITKPANLDQLGQVIARAIKEK